MPSREADQADLGECRTALSVGEGDLIVAKHRAGPTDTIVVAFQGHYSRFVDMQQN